MPWSDTVGKTDTIVGLAEKGQQGLLAYRFRTHGDLVRYAKENGPATNFDLQRWKLSGLPITTGIAGVFQTLQALQWEVEEVIYQDNNHAVFTCSSKGKSEQAHFILKINPELCVSKLSMRQLVKPLQMKPSQRDQKFPKPRTDQQFKKTL